MSAKGVISFLLGLLGVAITVFIPGSETYFKIFLGLAVGGVIEFMAYLYINRKNLDILKLQVVKRNKPMRITTAYLYRIEINGKYLLTKRHKKDSQGYQPVGGAYKYLKDETRELFNRLDIEPCNKVPRDEDTENDLRIIIRQRKNLHKYLKWLSSRKDREIDPWREFYEELVAPGLIPENLFRHIKYVYCGKHQEFAIPSPVFNIDEFRYADIYDWRPENDQQKQAIEKLAQRTDEVIFATPEEIRNGHTESGLVIRPHSFKIL